MYTVLLRFKRMSHTCKAGLHVRCAGHCRPPICRCDHFVCTSLGEPSELLPRNQLNQYLSLFNLTPKLSFSEDRGQSLGSPSRRGRLHIPLFQCIGRWKEDVASLVPLPAFGILRTRPPSEPGYGENSIPGSTTPETKSLKYII